jgi:hypothetical protein
MCEGPIRYDWLRFIPLRKNRHEIFAKLHSRILDLLYENPILESHTGDLVVPSQLTYVPQKFKDQNDVPLVPLESSDITYVSNGYHGNYEKVMKKLGVNRMSSKTFLQELSAYVSRHPKDFANQPREWHVRLSKILASLIHDDKSKEKHFTKLISDLKIIPLRDGQRWTSANAGTVLFPPDEKVLDVPKGIDIFVVHEDAYKDSEREQLLLLLHVKNYDNRYVCEAIVKTHQQKQFQPENLSPDDLISHIHFLIATDWAPKNSKQWDMWFLVEDGSRHLGSTVYIDSRSPYTATSMFQKRRSELLFLHPKYDSTLSESSSRWKEKLHQYHLLETLPRLITPPPILSGNGTYTISNDFRSIIRYSSPVKALLLLREHWNHYEKRVLPGKNSQNERENTRKSKSMARDFLSSMMVPCQGGIEARLDCTLLPRRSIFLANGYSLQLKSHLDREERPTGHTPKGYFDRLKGRVFGEVKSRSDLSDQYLRPPSTDHDRIASSRYQSKSSSPPRHRRMHSSSETAKHHVHGSQGTTREHPLVTSRSGGEQLDKIFKESSDKTVEYDYRRSRHRERHSETQAGFQMSQSDQKKSENWTIAGDKTHGRLFLDVPDPDDERWDFLGHLGVMVKMNSAAIIDRLRRLRNASATKDQVTLLYEQIEISVHDIGANTIRFVAKSCRQNTGPRLTNF